MQGALPVEEMKARDSEGSDIVAHRLRAVCQPEQDVGRSVIAQGDRHLKKFPQRNIDICVGVFILQRAVGLRKNQILSGKVYWLVQAEFALFHQVQNR